MKYQHWLLLLCAALCMTGCNHAEPDTSSETAEATEGVEITAPAETETLPLPTNAPLAEADPNAVTFDEVGADIAVLIADDSTAVTGTLSVEAVEGNNMLKLTDTSTTADNLETAVQKVRINVSPLLAPEQLSLVDRIEFDLYAEAKDTLLVTEDGESRQAPGWIGGGGGTEMADKEWYTFADFSGSGLSEYVLPRCDACHVTFKFLLAASGKKWDETMTEPNFQIMRWGMQNVSDLYIDNITFYDADGNSIPLTLGGAEEAETDPAAEAEAT